ncbi:TonB-dependent receptor [Woodsholea maritima]|uniref:TonB-dependent receptor n=1 Tax=Woodsholea maritima TaxID=240237 RepID=UPI000382EEE2|nr:TonB-dependent receptor [Woodsholea maritima]
MTRYLMSAAVSALMASTFSAAYAQSVEATETETDATVEEQIIVVGQRQTFAVSNVSKDMLKRAPALTSVNEVLNELPGVLVTQGDYLGGSDIVTTIFMRGFRTGSGAEQIGTTLDGVPNGGSGYGGGSKANRYIDTLNLETVEVSQGTADVSSRSTEALGGTLNFITRSPADEQNVNLFTAWGDNNAHKYAARYDTGEFLPNTRAFISGSFAETNDWIDGEGTTSNDYATAKIESEFAGWDLTGFYSWNKADEHEYEGLHIADYYANPRGDDLSMNWTGDPQIDQNYRDAWRAIRENTLSYARVHRDFGALDVTATAYLHHMRGRGDWAPPYLVDVIADGAGVETENAGGVTHFGAAEGDRYYFVNPNGTQATPNTTRPGCELGKNGRPPAAAACYEADAIAVQSYRHSHYFNRRIGIMLDASYTFNIGAVENEIRGGFWYEDGKSRVVRDWHRILDTRVGPAFDHQPYYVQYIDDWTADTTMYYLEDIATFGPVTARIGVKQYFIDQTKHRQSGPNAGEDFAFDHESDPLISTGINYTTPIEGLEVFAGYSNNFAAISRGRVSEPEAELALLEPETAKNIEVGLRFNRGGFAAAATYYDITFENRIVSIRNGAVDGIDYLSETDSFYFNLGGLKSKGLEAIASYGLDNGLSLSGSFTYNDSTFTDVSADKGTQPGQQMWGSPKYQYVVAADYVRGPFEIGASVRYVGDRIIDNAARDTAPSYYITNGYVGVELDSFNDHLKGFNARLNVMNLTDEVYINGVYGGGRVLGGQPRTVMFSLSADF